MLSMEQAGVPYGEVGLPMSGHIIRNDVLPLPVKSWVSFFKRVGMPVCITDLNVCIDEAIIQTMAQNCLLRSDSIGQLKRLSLQDIKAIYRKAGKVE